MADAASAQPHPSQATPAPARGAAGAPPRTAIGHEPPGWTRPHASARLLLAAGLSALLAACGAQGGTPLPPELGTATAPAVDATAAGRPTPTGLPAPDTGTAAPTAPVDPLARRLDELLAGRPGRYHVVVARPGEVPLYSRGAAEPVEAASLYKLAIMVELYRRREAGTLAFAEELVLDPAFFLEDAGEGFAVGERAPVGDLLARMIADSSNVAAAALLDRVGNGAGNAAMAELGLASTAVCCLPRGAADPSGACAAVATQDAGVYNVTSAADMARLFDLLLAGGVVSADASAAMLALLARQTIDDRLPARLPAGGAVAHKTGNLPGLVHDVGVIYAPDGPVIVAALATGVDETAAVEVLARLGALLYLG